MVSLSDGDRRGPLVGASVLSSIGSLPLHLVPLIVVALIADSRASVANAGWLATAILIGQLSTALALPALRIFQVRRALALGAGGLLLAALVVSSASNFSVLLLGWFVVGQSCGVLAYLGTMAASQFPRRQFAFALRLAIVLIVAGFVSGLLQASHVLASYPSLLTALFLTIIPLFALGFIWYRPASPMIGPPRHGELRTHLIRRSSGLVTVYFFFVGQTGFLAYVVQQAIGRGMTLESTAWSLAAMKVAAGLWILCSAYWVAERRAGARFASVSLLLIGAILVLANSRDVIVFFSALLALEVALNTLSARLQAAVVTARPELSGPWLTGIMLLGAATGPPLNGYLISIGLDGVFVLVAVLSAVAPLLWIRLGASDGASAQVQNFLTSSGK